MKVKEISYSESQKISTGQYETTLVSFSATVEPHEGQSPEDASIEVINFVRTKLNEETSKYRKK